MNKAQSKTIKACEIFFTPSAAIYTDPFGYIKQVDIKDGDYRYRHLVNGGSGTMNTAPDWIEAAKRFNAQINDSIEEHRRIIKQLKEMKIA